MCLIEKYKSTFIFYLKHITKTEMYRCMYVQYMMYLYIHIYTHHVNVIYSGYDKWVRKEKSQDKTICLKIEQCMIYVCAVDNFRK